MRVAIGETDHHLADDIALPGAVDLGRIERSRLGGVAVEQAARAGRAGWTMVLATGAQRQQDRQDDR